MSLLDHQLGFVKESTYGTAVTVTKFAEYLSESIDFQAARTETDPLRAGTLVKRNDRFTPYVLGAQGPLSFDVMTKGFAFWLEHMLGSVATTGPAETVVFTHTGTMGDLTGKSLSLQVARPFTPSGTAQALTCAGGKVMDWTLSNTVDGNLMAELTLDFQSFSTATGLAAASYPASMENFTWAKGTVLVGGSQFDIDNISIKGSNNLATDRRQIRNSTLKKEPLAGRRTLEWAIDADFVDLTQQARVHSATRAGALASIQATWIGPTILGTTIFPTIDVLIPAARFDAWQANVGDSSAIKQNLTGVGLYDGTNSPVTITVKTADATP